MEPGKTLSILILFSPVFISVLLLAYLLKVGWDRLEKYSLYWLATALILTVVWVYALVSNQISSRILLWGVYASEAYSTYLLLKEREKKKNSKRP
ncbi:MAG: hypothetical protein Q8N84_01945 [bacterium]|nr:hypothetical protein [bacterium]